MTNNLIFYLSFSWFSILKVTIFSTTSYGIGLSKWEPYSALCSFIWRYFLLESFIACRDRILGNAIASAFRLGKAVVGEGVTLLAASRTTEISAEANDHGAFTRLLLEG